MATQVDIAELERMKAALIEPYRIYKPLFIDPNNVQRDLDREFENISQALIWVTKELENKEAEIVALTKRVVALEAKP